MTVSLAEALDGIRDRLDYLQRIQPERYKRTPLYKCRQCWDEGFIVVDEPLNTYRPCGPCRGVQFSHWKKGGYRSSWEGGWAMSSKRQAQEPAQRDRSRFGGVRGEDE